MKHELWFAKNLGYATLMASPHIPLKSYSCLASHRGALFRAGELHLSLIYTKDPRTMFSPTAIGDYIATMNSADNPVVPKFMFLLNNRSSFSNPRKEAIRFRDLYHCLNPSLLRVKHIWLPTKSLQSFWCRTSWSLGHTTHCTRHHGNTRCSGYP
jgi:hypothetical protein